MPADISEGPNVTAVTTTSSGDPGSGNPLPDITVPTPILFATLTLAADTLMNILVVALFTALLRLALANEYTRTLPELFPPPSFLADPIASVRPSSLNAVTPLKSLLASP